MTPVKKGCAIIAVSVPIGLMALLCWPYRMEIITGFVSRNETTCTVEAVNNSGWTSHSAVPGIDTESVKYPLEVSAFVTGCSGLPNGQPFSAELISPSGKVVARGLGCADAPGKDYPCQLDAPPIMSLRGSDRYIVRVVPVRGAAANEAEFRLESSVRWSNGIVDVLMSV